MSAFLIKITYKVCGSYMVTIKINVFWHVVPHSKNLQTLQRQKVPLEHNTLLSGYMVSHCRRQQSLELFILVGSAMITLFTCLDFYYTHRKGRKHNFAKNWWSRTLSFIRYKIFVLACRKLQASERKVAKCPTMTQKFHLQIKTSGFHRFLQMCEICGSHSTVDEESNLLGCHTASGHE